MRVRVGVGAVIVSVTAACGQSPPPAAVDARPPAAIALVETDGGLAGVVEGSSTPAWTVRGAVAAPDGSAVFAVADGDELVRVDRRTGATTSVGSIADASPGLHVAAVEPGGGRVALVGEPVGGTTVVDVFDPEAGRVVVHRTFFGDIDPEAFSIGDDRLFGARSFGDHYRVHVFDLASGDQYPTSGPDKTVDPEDMYGSVVQAALSPDRLQLATLYRDPGRADHTAFVHLLRLDSGSTVCIDLAAPFGVEREPLVDRLAWLDGVTLGIAHGDSVATVSAEAIWTGEPQPHYHPDGRADPSVMPALPDGLAGVPGFRRLVAVVPSD